MPRNATESVFTRETDACVPRNATESVFTRETDACECSSYAGVNYEEVFTREGDSILVPSYREFRKCIRGFE